MRLHDRYKPINPTVKSWHSLMIYTTCFSSPSILFYFTVAAQTLPDTTYVTGVDSTPLGKQVIIYHMYTSNE